MCLKGKHMKILFLSLLSLSFLELSQSAVVLVALLSLPHSATTANPPGVTGANPNWSTSAGSLWIPISTQDLNRQCPKEGLQSEQDKKRIL